MVAVFQVLPALADETQNPVVDRDSLSEVLKATSGKPEKTVDAASKEPQVFEVDGHKAYVYSAPEPAIGKPWIWYAPVINGNVIIIKHDAYTDSFLKAGIAIAGYDIGEVRGSPTSTAQFTRFYDAMVERGFSEKPIILGQSRGGIMTLAWAFRNPEKVKAWAGIYPVCNLLSYPLKSTKKQTLADFAMSEEALTAKLAELNPIENLAGLAKHKVPLFSVHGDKDILVPYADNTLLLKERYEALSGPISVKIIVGGGHEVSDSFFKCPELISFIIEQSRL
jgi:pimeloyl-ACP methyl ester carboxylesterase